MSLIARCPAKINLSLRVLGRRPDGYHDLRTIFQTVDLWDTLEAERAPDLTLACDVDRVPIGPDNLVIRAAQMLRDREKRPLPGAAFRLRKEIPVGGGMGGGSTDAAGALVLLCRIWNLSLAPAELGDVASRLGADVPFFLRGGTALGTGRGDQVEPRPFVGSIPLLLGFPPFAIETARVYRRMAGRLTPPGNGVTVTGFPGNLPWRNDLGAPINDLEAVVFDGWPELGAFRDALLAAGAEVALLSGSGSTVFGLFSETGRVRAAVEELGPRFEGWRLKASRTIEAAAHVADAGEGPRHRG